MQFRTTTLLLIMSTLALPLAITAPAGKATQGLSLLTAVLAWMGVFITAWASDWPNTKPLFGHIIALTAGIFGAMIGMLGVCFCVGSALATIWG